MELSEFVHRSIVEIAKGLRQANDDVRTLMGADGPRNFVPLKPGGTSDAAGLRFDVAVTSRAEAAGSAGVTVRLAVVDAKVGGDAGRVSEHISRIQFIVAVDQYIG